MVSFTSALHSQGTQISSFRTAVLPVKKNVSLENNYYRLELLGKL